MQNVLILQWGRFGAGPRIARELAAELSARDDVRVFLSYSTDAETRADFAAMNLESFPVATFRSALGLLGAICSLPVVFVRLRRFMRRNRIDSIVSPMYSPLALAVVLFMRGVTYVSCIHDARPHPGDQRLYSALLPFEVKRASTVIAFSADVETSLRSRFPTADIRRTVHGAFRASTPGVSETDDTTILTIGMFGRLGEYQGVDIFVEAVGIVRAAGREIRARVVGKGTLDTARLASGPSDVEWELGWVPEDAVNATVRSFDILALPYREASQSGVFAVAMAEGVPVVATPVGGLIEQVHSTGAGILSSAPTAESFAESLIRMIDDDELRQRATDNGRSAARNSMSWAAAADTVLDALRKADRPAGR